MALKSTASLGADEDEPLRCISLSRIDRTEVIDDRNIAFYLKGGDIYVNRLNRACPRLDSDRPFSYRTSTGRLCAADVITVLENSSFGLTAGASCALSAFAPADEEYVEMLKGDEEPAEVTIEEIEVEE